MRNETMSSSITTPSGLAQYYPLNNPFGQVVPNLRFGSDRVEAASVVNASSTLTTTPASRGGGGIGGRDHQQQHLLTPEGGRVTKPPRRSRTSRRTPTTLFNTDTTNFRAMVQQFTGGPKTPFAVAIGYPQPTTTTTTRPPRVASPSPSASPYGYHHLDHNIIQFRQPQQQSYNCDGFVGRPKMELISEHDHDGFFLGR